MNPSSRDKENQAQLYDDIKIALHDNAQIPGYLYIRRNIMHLVGSKRFYIYCSNYILNETPYKFYYFFTNPQKKNNSQAFCLYPGQQQSKKNASQELDLEQQSLVRAEGKISLLTDQNDVILALSPDTQYFSNQLPLTGYGKKSIEMKVPLINRDQNESEFIDINLNNQVLQQSKPRKSRGKMK